MYMDRTFANDYLRMHHSSLKRLTVDHRNAISSVLHIDDESPQRLLDLGCGPGRLAIEFAERGHEVVGVDQSSTLLATAERLATDRQVEVQWVRSRYQDLPDLGSFDAIYCWSTSFGYGPDEENELILRRCREMLTPGGKLTMESSNWSYWPRPFEPVEMEVNGDDWLVCRSTFDPASARQTITEIYHCDGQVIHDEHSIRRFWPSELALHLRLAGFGRVDLLGEDLRPITTDHRRLVAVATA